MQYFISSRSVKLSAIAAGNMFLGGFTRQSAHSFSGVVFVAVFRSSAVAGQFARAWSRRIPPVCGGCSVRQSGHRRWQVSVPVAASQLLLPCPPRHRLALLLAWQSFRAAGGAAGGASFSACLRQAWASLSGASC